MGCEQYSRHSFGLSLGVTTLFALVCCAGPPARRLDSSPDILLITLDTARADRFSFMGSSPVLTPRIDQLAAEGAAFLSAVAPSPITLVSHVSLFTGLYPPNHGVRDNGRFVLGSEHLTLAEILRARGYETGAFIGAAVLDSQFGLDQGFDAYDDDILATDTGGMFTFDRRTGRSVVASTLQWIESRGPDPILVWVHLYDLHAPYRLTEEDMNLYSDRPYDGLIADVDRITGELIDRYKSLRNYDNTIVVLTADHGESLGEHREKTHGVFVYESAVRIPLVIRGPGIPAGVAVKSQAQLVDVTPTLLSLVGTEIPERTDGRNLLPHIQGASAVGDDERAYLESFLPLFSYGWSGLRGVRTSRWKYVEGVEPELYDLLTDPREEVDLADTKPELVRDFQEWIQSKFPSDSPEKSTLREVEEGLREKLEALGYLGGGPKSPEDREELDPREMIGVQNDLSEALRVFERGSWDTAVKSLTKLATENPSNLAILRYLGQVLLRAGRYREAVEVYGRASSLDPDDAGFHEKEGRALEGAGRLEEALEAYRRALTVDPKRVGARAHRWTLLARLNRESVVLEEATVALENEPGDGEAAVQILKIRHGSQPPEVQVEAFERALRTDPEDEALMAELARVHLSEGNVKEAEQLFRNVLRYQPGHHDACLVLGRLELHRGRPDRAKTILAQGARKYPEKPAMQIALATALLRSADVEGASIRLQYAQRLSPERPDLWAVWGELWLIRGVPKMAVQSLERAVEFGTEDWHVWEKLAQAYRDLGRASDANAALAEATRRSRNSAPVR